MGGRDVLRLMDRYGVLWQGKPKIWWLERPQNARVIACKYATWREALKIKDFAVIKRLKKP